MIFDNKYRFSNFFDFVYLKLAKIERFKYYISYSSFIFVKKVDFFRIFKRVENFAYKLELFKNFKIHNVVFVIYLKQVFSNFFVKNISLLFFLLVKSKELYIMKKILRKKQRGKKANYIIK